ncbi:sulfatase-like hydrolase/transferase [Streptomyces albus]|uniref:sulfatase-like hydrolase/transferase n=1 Tax=Streptomyces albus TaxID=1888 RepID=UPI00131B239F|nr:sulfatase-like hydrolase/transferase [Streptomyces albus]
MPPLPRTGTPPVPARSHRDPGPGPGPGRKILLIVADQLRADALGAYGNPAAPTPHLDELAARGALFEQHYSASAPCGPARASLLTGLHQAAHGVVSNTAPLDPALPTLATALRTARIPCHVVGYTDSVHEDGRDGAEEAKGVEGVPAGFSWHTRFNLNDPGLRGWLETLRAAGYPVPPRPADVFRPAEGTAHRARYDAEHSDTAYVADRTIDCLTEHRDEPWLILSTFLRPHPPWVAPPPYDTLYEPAAMAAPRRLPTREAQGAVHPFLRRWIGRPGPDTAADRLTDAAVARGRAVYLGLLTEVDHHVGRILAALRRTGQAEETLVVFTADHGDTLGDQWTLGTGGFAAGAYRVPLIIAAPDRPGAPSGPRRTDRFTESVDLLPTVLDWAGVPGLPGACGRSLLPFLHGPYHDWFREQAVCEFHFRAALRDTWPWAARAEPGACRLTVLRGASHTYVRFPTLPPLLFDRTADPGELRDLAGEPGSRPLLDAFAERVREHERLHPGRPAGRREMTHAHG